MAAEPTSPDPEKRYINVEFDDGDSGRIALEDIRFLLSDYPIVGKFDQYRLLHLNRPELTANLVSKLILS